MRKPLPLAAAIACLSAFAAPAGAQEVAAEKRAMDVNFDVPQDMGIQLVSVMTRDIPPGGEVPWHTHPGVEIAYVEVGELELWMAGKPIRRLGPGDSFTALRGTVHGGRNVGEGPARLVITYVVDRDVPLRSSAPVPDGY
ncbi:MAG: cupin domain-containing protein [Novosphingobium sp.]|nr:cupin domain-containing protein [Novosphingobium sp.]